MMSTSKNIILVPVFVATLLACLVGEAAADRVELSLGSGVNFVPLESMDALSDDSTYVGFAMGLGLRLPEVTLIPGTSTEVVLGYDSGSLQGQSFGVIRSELSISTLSVNGRIRRQLFSWGSAFLQGGIGWQRAELSLREIGGASQGLKGDSQGVSGLASLGFDLMIYSRPTAWFSLSLRSEIGYRASTSLRMDATPSGGDSLSIATQSRDLGSVNASGATIRWGLVGSL